VKPYEAETDLDALFQKIVQIQMDGLLWKQDYKKDPIAYGVCKLVVGCVIEDDKVSVDDLQEAIQAFEEEVQSVDIAVFNKI
jgi:elongation factor 1-beta